MINILVSVKTTFEEGIKEYFLNKLEHICFSLGCLAVKFEVPHIRDDVQLFLEAHHYEDKGGRSSDKKFLTQHIIIMEYQVIFFDKIVIFLIMFFCRNHCCRTH